MVLLLLLYNVGSAEELRVILFIKKPKERVDDDLIGLLYGKINNRKMVKINVQNTAVNIVRHNDEDYISLTDMARSQMQEHIIFRWLSLKPQSFISVLY
ncbi:hypothetical protein JCM15124A_02410 [Prevotella falsenii]